MCPTNDPSRRVRSELVYSRVHCTRWRNVPANPIIPYPTGRPLFLGRFQVVNCQATIIPSLRDKNLPETWPQNPLHRVTGYCVSAATRLPSKPESGSGAAQATQRSRPRPDKESKPTGGQNLVLELLPWVPTETFLSRTGPDRSRSSRPAQHWKGRMPLRMPHKPVTRSGSLRRKRDTDQLWALASLRVTLAQSSTRNT